jgi:cation transport protein ChaC
VTDEPVLSRAMIEAGGIDAMVAKIAPNLKLLTEAERAASLRATLAARPPGDAWLFGYGSLIWNPTIHSVERRTARIVGWHRAFCVSIRAGRGTWEKPGLVLGLDAGGSCTGVAFRIAEDVLESELSLLWRREMLAGSYVPRWLDVLDPLGVRFGSAITFTINPTCEQYAGNLARDVIVQRLATATGPLGSAADYLFRTRDGLREQGIPDPELERLAAYVEAAQAIPGAGPAET